MRALIELVHIVSKNKVKEIHLIGSSNGKSLKVNKFYELLRQDKVHSDEEAIRLLFPEKKSPSAYKRLKGNLRKRLLNTLFFVDINKPGYSDRQKAYYRAYREWAAAMILFGKNARVTAVDLSENIFKYSRRYEFSKLSFEIAQMLRLHFGTRVGNRKKFQFYNQLTKEFKGILAAEELVEERYIELFLESVNKKSSKKAILKNLYAYLEEVQAIEDQYPVYQIQLLRLMIELMLEERQLDHKAMIDTCKRGIALFSQKPYQAHVPLNICYYQQLICHLYLKNYEEGLETAREGLEYVEEGAFNWFKYQELLFLLAMHTRSYEGAKATLDTVTRHKRFQFLPGNVVEVWKIFQAYMAFLQEGGKAPADKKTPKKNRFRLGKFMNETPIYSKDKRGLNIPILIIQILFFIKRGEYAKVIDRIDALRQYNSRYLKRNATFRSNSMIRMLLQIPACDFQKEAMMRKTADLYAALSDMPLHQVDQSHEIEIIPYEDLWKMTLELL